MADIISPRVTTATDTSEKGTVMLTLPLPYLLFLGDCTEQGYAKTAYGLRDWANEKCVGEYVLPTGSVSTGLPPMNPAEAAVAGARSMIIGVANPGGVIPDTWMAGLQEALEAGLDLISGMHSRLSDYPELKALADRLGRRLIDVRVPPKKLPVGTGRPRSGKRILTVGTDCALGKKYTALALSRDIADRGIACDFRATGQTGIMIAGEGIPIDAVVSDFLAGAAETLSPDADPEHWDVVEGQGSLFHPAYSGVSLGLLHGSQPDVIVVCHDPSRDGVLGVPGYALPGLQETIDLTLTLARRTNPDARCAGISVNTSRMTAEEAESYMKQESEALGMPVADPIRGGDKFSALVDSCLNG